MTRIIDLPVKFKRDSDKFLVYSKSYDCLHNGGFIVDPDLAEVTCQVCKQKINPIVALTKLAHSETKWHEHRKIYQDEVKRLGERSKTKCDHCGKMTSISRK